MEQNKSTRRRGDELLEDLYEAAIALSNTTKLTNMTFQQIAEKANTSRTVLYRRWNSPFELLQDIYVYKARKLFEENIFDELSDNGNLKDDLFQLLEVYQNLHDEIGHEVINSYYFLRMHDRDNLQKPITHISAIEKYLNAMNKILENAKLRGEKVKKVSEITLMLPFDMLRIENLIRSGNANKQRLMQIVNEVLIPVYLK